MISGCIWSRIFVTDITVFYKTMLVAVRDPKMFWAMSLKASVRAWGFCVCVMGTSTAQQQSKCLCVINTLSVTNPNHRTTKDTIKKIISVWARPSIVYFCINFSVRWEPGFIFDLEHYERKEAMVFGTELLQHSDCVFFLLCVSLIWMAKRN